MLYGIDRLNEFRDVFLGKRLGLVTSPTGLNRKGESTIDILHRTFGLTALFSPEHGVRGSAAAGAAVETYLDEETGVPVYSLYRGDSRRMTQEMLDRVDAVVYDIQDVGARYYTFLSTLLYVMEDCAGQGKTIIVLDRPNPLGGVTVEGNLLKEAYRSFVGGYPLCMRYGLTQGEYARMACDGEKLDCDLRIVPCCGWKRNMQFPDYGTVWVPPSGNIPRFETALLYPGTCLFEATNLSEGRGTAFPFEVVGAPFINAAWLARLMNEKNLPGVWFRPVWFIPSASKFSGRMCGGIQMHVTDRVKIRPVDIGVHLLYAIRSACPEFAFRAPLREGGRRTIDLLGGDSLLGEEGHTPEEILEGYRKESGGFMERSREYRLYSDR